MLSKRYLNREVYESCVVGIAHRRENVNPLLILLTITALPDVMRYNYRGQDASDYGQDARTVRNSIHTL